MEIPKKDLRHLNIKLTEHELVRFTALFDRVMERTRGEARITSIIKELMGLQPPRVTEAGDREMLAPSYSRKSADIHYHKPKGH